MVGRRRCAAVWDGTSGVWYCLQEHPDGRVVCIGFSRAIMGLMRVFGITTGCLHAYPVADVVKIRLSQSTGCRDGRTAQRRL
jgi:hypothetical protein